MPDFVHLHLHSEYSLLDGACRISEIPKAAKSAGHSAVALTDHGVMYGAVAFYKACKKEGVKPIIGCEVYVAPNSRFSREGKAEAYDHLVLLCKNETGYKNLIYLVSEAFISGFYVKPRIDEELLSTHSEGLIALSACLGGYVPKHIVSGDYGGAYAHAEKMKNLFKDDYYLEVQDHGIPDQKTVNEGIFDISEKLGIPVVATNDVHYLKRSDSEAQTVLMCIQTGSCIKDGRPIGFETDEYYYKETWEMERLFKEHPEVIENTVKVSEKCDLEFTFGKTCLPEFDCPDSLTPDEYLKKLTSEGLCRIKAERGLAEGFSEEDYNKRIDYELSVIGKMGYSGYYLIVRDFVNYAKTKGIPVGPGRGSGAGSLVAYLVGITDIDPLQFDLLFERFLNPERVSMPDFDIDFADSRRDEAIEYVREKYGYDRTAQIVTFGTLAAKAVIRDVGRALGMAYSDVDAVARLIPAGLDVTLDDAMKDKRFREMYDSSPEVKQLVDLSRALEGMPRHASTHAAGVVITPKPLTEYVPLSANGGVTVTQYEKTTVEELGLLKFDFLALRYLTIIDAAEKLIKENNPDFSIEKIPLNDEPTYKLISKGNTEGVFQLEKTGMRQMLTKLRPERIDDVIAALSLYRPGPMSSIDKYIDARHGGKIAEYPTPLLAPILDTTYGCIVYQEQVMQIFREIAGYSLGHADVVRRAIAKKHADELMREKDAFIDGAQSHGVDRESAEKMFEDIADFADYAFNKSHAAAYAVLSYRTAYLKAHYLLEYNCALITSVMNNPAKIYEYVVECKKHGIEVLPPDVNKSGVYFSVRDGSIRFGLGALKNIGVAFTEQLVSERQRNGEFTDFDDFIDRMLKYGMNKRHTEGLIKSGSLDCFGIYRSRMLAVNDILTDRSGSSSLEGQLDIFSSSPGEVRAPKTEFPEIPEFTVFEKLKLENESSGMFLSGSLLDSYSENVEKLSPASVADILRSFSADSETAKYHDKDTVTVCGIVTSRTNKMTKAGQPMAFITLEGADASVEVIVFPKSFEQYAYLLTEDAPIAARARISAEDDGDSVKLILSEAITLSENGTPPSQFREAAASYSQRTAQPVKKAEQTAGKLYLKVKSMDAPETKRALAFIGIFSGKVPVVIYDSSLSKASMLKDYGACVNDFTVRELTEILGDGAVVVK